MSNHEKYLARFADVTGAMLVAGREGDLPYEELLRVLDVLADNASAGGRAPICVPAHDLSEDPAPDDSVTFVIGFPCGSDATAGFAPGRATCEEIAAALAAAEALGDAFWASLDPSLVAEPTAVKAVPYGSLAGVLVAFGVRQHAGKTVEDMAAEGADDEDDDHDPDDWEWKLPAPPAGLARVIGKDMQQRSHPDHVLGLQLGYGGDWTTVTLDVSEALHAERVGKLSAHGLSDEAAYWVLGVYD